MTLQLLHLCVESCGVTTQINSPWQNSYMVLHVPTSLDFTERVIGIFAIFNTLVTIRMTMINL